MKKVILYSLSVLVLIFLVEQVFKLPYIFKTLIKAPLFLIYPLSQMKKDFKLRKRWLKKSLIYGGAIAGIIVVAYLILYPFIDLSAIQSDMAGRMAISRTLFFFAAMYTIFINALLEEIFFRAYIYKGIRSKKLAYIYSSLAFALYHLAIFGTWFSLPLLGLALVGLLVGGLIFSYITDKSGSFIGAYIVHIGADIGVVLVGLHVLGYV